MSTKRLRVKISPDRLEAWVEALPGSVGGVVEVRQALFCAGVVYGIDESAVSSLGARLARPDFRHSGTLLARGRPADHGVDGELVLHFRLTVRVGHDRDGALDVVDRSLLRPVRVGDVVASYRPPTYGAPGVGVDDSQRKARDGRHRMPRLGPGVCIDEGREIRATVDGVINLVRGELLDVVPESAHRGDVDARSGNIDADGSLTVQGRVRRGFSVRATGSVEIRRGIEAGSVYAGGNIRVGHGVVGGEAARLLAVGGISTHFVQNAEIECGGELRVTNDIQGSRLRVGAVNVGGRLSGGELIVDGPVSARELGSAAGQITRVWAGVLRREPIVVAPKVAPLRRPSSRPPSDESERPASSREPRSAREVGADIAAALETAYVEADLVHPGVAISIGGRQWLVHRTMRNVRFRFDPDYNAIVIARRVHEYAA